jgi:predicted membrane protein
MADTPGTPKSPWEEQFDRKRQRWEAKMERRRAKWEARAARGVAPCRGYAGALIGLILAGVGVLLLLQNLGIIVVDDLWDYWPVILIVFGFSRVVDSWSMGGRIWGGLMAAAGTIFLLRNLDIIHTNVWNLFWPGLLILVGLGMLFRTIEGGSRVWWTGRHTEFATSDESTLTSAKIDSVFSHAERHFDTQEFEGGEVNAVFGGVELDLRKAEMKMPQVRLECNAVFGGIEIRIPETWTVLLRGTGVFGGFSDETHPPPRSDKTSTLLITGGAVFGGVNVKN